MSNTWFIADYHFNHANIIKYENRPFANVDEMEKEMIRRTNEKVRAQDRLFIVGDFGFGPWEKLAEIIAKINGRKTLILGNHDKTNLQGWRDAGIEEVSKYSIIFKEFYIVSHHPQYMNKNMPYANIYGHVHSHDAYRTWSNTGVCVSLERHDYYPVNFADIEEHFTHCEPPAI